MRRVLYSVLLSCCAVLLGFINTIYAQSQVRTFSPVRVKIELSGVEPRPDGVAAEVTWVGGGAGGSLSADKRPRVYWVELPKPLTTPVGGAFYFPPAPLTACGYISGQPTATLTLPNGTQQSINGETANVFPNKGERPVGCWQYAVNWVYGMELGLYTLTLDGSEGMLTHTWGMDYGYCRSATYRPGDAIEMEPGKEKSWLFTGFTPNEHITVHFYADTGRMMADQFHGISDYLATRTLIADADGAFMLDVTVTRSAPFAGKGIQYRIQGYGDESDPDGFPSLLHPDNLACSIDYTKSQPGRPVIPLYPAIDDLSGPVGYIRPDQTAQVLEVVPAIRNGHVILWALFRTNQGQEGWTNEPDCPVASGVC